METLELYNVDESCKIRCYFDEQKGCMFSVYDFINLACDKPLRDDHGRITFTRMETSFRTNCSEWSFHQFETDKQKYRETPVMNIRQLQQILMKLPGKTGNKYRDIAESTVTRVLAGDSSLIPIIEANAESSSPLNIIAKDTLNRDSYDRSNDLFLQGRIDKLTQKVSKLKLLIEKKDNLIEQKDTIIQNKDIIIEENRLVLREKDTTISDLCSSNKILVKANDKIKTTNSKLIQNFAIIPESNSLVEYLVIVRKNKDNFHYEEIVYEEEEIDIPKNIDTETRKKIEKEERDKRLERILSTNCKHYIIRCQYRAIHNQIKNLKDKYDLDNIHVIHCERNPNPGTLTHVLKQQEFVDYFFGNHLQIIDEISLINYIRNYVSNEITN